MALIPEEKIAEIRDRTDIVQVVGEYVSLRRSGGNHIGLCPFHNEKTPSFNVNAAKQMYHCFGCGKSGDVFRFLMDFDGRAFPEVVREMAKRAGVDIPEPEQTPAQKEAQRRAEGDRARLIRLNQLACDFFRGELASPRGDRGRAYVDKRGIGAAVREQFLLGYAPAGWDGLVRFFEAKKVPADLAERAGLLRARDGAKRDPNAPPSKNTHFDLFRDRVMFPLVNPQGEVIAFGGRTLDTDEKTPKYINSPETILYKKGENLYGLHAAKASIRKTGRAILVEGNFDVLMMHEKGLSETVAPMGTALTPQQVHLLHRYLPPSGKAYIFLDGDNAGRKAAARDVGVFLDEELLAYVSLLPDGDDPDTFVAKHGRDGVELLFKRAREAVDYFCSVAWKASGSSPVEAAKVIEEEAAPLLRKVRSEAARDKYIGQLALLLGFDRAIVEKAVRGVRVVDDRKQPQAQQAAATAPATPTVKLTSTDLELVALIADHPQLLARLNVSGALKCIGHPALKRALADLAARTDTFKLDVAKLADAVDAQARAQIMEAALSGRYADVADPEKALRGIVQKYGQAGVVAELKKALAEARAAGDLEEARKLNLRINELNQQRLGLKG